MELLKQMTRRLMAHRLQRQPSTPVEPIDPNPVPEPITLALLGLSLAGLAVRRRLAPRA